MLFPEGERKSGPIVQPLFDGAAYVAVKAGVPIVPVGIGGSERVMPKGARFIYPKKVVAIIGAPIHRAARRVRQGAARRGRATSPPSCTTSCSACSTPPRSAPAEPRRSCGVTVRREPASFVRA